MTQVYPGGPDRQTGETVTVGYGVWGLAETLTGASAYVTGASFTPDLRPQLLKLGGTPGAPAIQVRYTYYPWEQPAGRGRLQAIESGPPADPTALQALHYTYDLVGNVATIEDDLSGRPPLSLLYDELDRLVYARGPYLESYGYSKTGNIQKRDGWAVYEYDAGQVHAVRRVQGTGAPVTATVTIRARGVEGGGVLPRMELWINGTLRDTWTVLSSTTYLTYTTETPLAGDDICEVWFANGGEGRELWVDRVTLGAVAPPPPPPLVPRMYLPLVMRGEGEVGGLSASQSAPLAQAEGPGPTVAVEAEGGAMVYVRGDFEPGRERLDSTGALRFAVGPHAYAADYDANGNMTSRVVQGRGQVLSWDGENRLVSVAGATSVVTFAYDGDGNRVRTVVSDTAGVTVTVHIGGYYELTNGTQGRSYYHHNDRPIAMRDGSGLHWLLADHLGSTTLVADAGGAAEGELRYSPFGVTLYEEGTAATDRRFTGQRWQATVGLYDYRARWYDPRLGRFVSPDTIVPEPGEPQSLNRFSYVYGNPLKHTDPTGRDPREWDPAWVRRFVDAHGYLPCEQDWLDYLFSLEHPGSGPNGAWTPEDWDAYREIRMLLGPSLLRQIGSAGGPYALYTRIGHLLAGPSVGTWALHDDVLLTASHDVPPGASAWTWGDLVILHTGYWIHDPGSRQLQLTLIHEYVHVLQYRKHGLSFGVKYLAGGLSWNTNPFEVQAVAVEDWYRQHPHFPAPWTFTWPREERYLAYTRWPW